MSILDSVRRFFANPPASVPAPIIIRSAGAPVPRGRQTQNGPDSFPLSTWTILPPAGYEANWQLVNLNTRYLELLSPAELMETLADLSPEVSRALWDFLRLCNPGWEVKALRATADKKAEIDPMAQAAIDGFLASLTEQHGVVDVVIGRLFMAAFLRGALCAELVLDRRGRLALDLATPDPISIRFRKRSDEVLGERWQPGQWQAGRFVPLDIPTVRYVPIDPMLGSPYGRPMAAPALFTSLFLLGVLHDLRRVIQQQGYPRLDIAIDTKRIAESLPSLANDQDKFLAEVQKIVEMVASAYRQLQPDDTYIHTDIATINRPVGAVDAGSLGGIDAIIAALERMAVRALKTMPLMLGLDTSTNETNGNREWEIYAAGIKSIQHYTENMLEGLLTLALEAQGIQAKVEFRFAELRAAEMLRDIQVETMRIANAKAKYEAGWVSQDQAAEEITGKPADVPAPRIAGNGQQDILQDDNDGSEALNQGSDDRAFWLAELRQARIDVQEALSIFAETDRSPVEHDMPYTQEPHPNGVH